MSIEIKVVKDNSAACRAAIKSAVRHALEDVGDAVVGWSQDNFGRYSWSQSTGNLKGSIESQMQGDDKVQVGSNVEYATYVEMGTGIYSTMGGRQTPWVYCDDAGNFHMTSGMSPRPYLKPAVTEHEDKIKSFIEQQLHSEL